MASNTNRGGGLQFFDVLECNNLKANGNVTTTSLVAILDTTPSTSTSTGAFQCDGGISVDNDSWFGGDIVCEGLLTATLIKRATKVSTSTELVDASQYGRIEARTAGITISLTNLTDEQDLEIANESDGDIYLNFDIVLQGTVYSAPVTVPAGDVYPLKYDLANTRFKF